MTTNAVGDDVLFPTHLKEEYVMAQKQQGAFMILSKKRRNALKNCRAYDLSQVSSLRLVTKLRNLQNARIGITIACDMGSTSSDASIWYMRTT